MYVVSGPDGILTTFSLTECLAFAALISAVDPVSTLGVFGHLKVDPNLNVLVYGESVINDAVAIVLYRTFVGFMMSSGTAGDSALSVLVVLGLFVGSTLCGLLVAVLCALSLKSIRTYDPEYKTTPMFADAALMLLWSYFAFEITEALHLSGIVASLVAG